MKKIWVALVSLLLMLTVAMPVSAEENYEAKAGESYYATLKEALEAGGEVTLLKDVSVDEIIEVTQDTTLNLGNFTITNNVELGRPLKVTASKFKLIADKGGMVIPATNVKSYGFIEAYVTDFSIEGGHYIGNTENGCFFRMNTTESIGSAAVNIEGISAETNCQVFRTNGNTFDTFSGSIKNSTLNAGKMAIYYDVMDTSENSTITIENVKAVVNRGSVLETAGGNTVLIDNDWTVTGDYSGDFSWSRSAIGIGYQGVVTVKSGTYSAKSEHMKENEGFGAYIYSSGGKLNIEGGTFIGSTAAVTAGIDSGTYPGRADVVINGGTFEGDVYTCLNSGNESITINDGHFTDLTEKTTANQNKLEVKGGVFDLDIQDKTSEDAKVIAIDGLEGEALYYIGEKRIEEGLKDVAKGDKIDVIKNVDSIEVPNGVEVTNHTGKEITVNGRPVADDKPIIAEDPSVVTINGLNDLYTVGHVVEFKVTTKPASYDQNKMVKSYITNLDNEEKNLIKIWYKESKTGEWLPLTTDEFGSSTGFPFVEAASEFKMECLNTGNLDFGIEIRSLDGKILASTTHQFVIAQMETLNQAPVIHASDVTLTVGDSFDPLKGVTATDQEDGEIKDIQVISNTVDTTKAGTYEVTYKATDSHGASSTKTIKVVVNEKTTVTPGTNEQSNHTQSGGPTTGITTESNPFIPALIISGVLLTALLVWKKKKAI